MPQHFVEIPISISTLKYYPDDIASFESGLCEDLTDHKREFSELLRPKDPRGTIEDRSISFDTLELQCDTGSVWVSYTEEAYYGRKDKDHVDEIDDVFRFTLNTQRNVMKFEMTPKPERYDEI